MNIEKLKKKNPSKIKIRKRFGIVKEFKSKLGEVGYNSRNTLKIMASSIDKYKKLDQELS